MDQKKFVFGGGGITDVANGFLNGMNSECQITMSQIMILCGYFRDVLN